MLVEPCAGAGGAVQLVAHALELPCNVHELRLVAVLHGEDAAACGAGGLEGVARADEALEQGVVVVGGNAQHFAGRLHLGAELGIHTVQLFKAEHRHLDGHIGCVGVQAGAIAHICQLLAQTAAHCQIHHGHAGDLGDIRHSTGGTGVHLNDVHSAVGDSVLHIHQTGDMQLAGKAAGVVHHGIDLGLSQVLCRVDADGVAGVHAGALHLLHDAGDQEVLAVADGVHFALGAQNVLIQQHGVIHVHMLGDDAHVLNDVCLGVSHDHVLTAQHVGGAHQHRQADLIGSGQRLVQIEHSAARCAGNLAALQQLVEALTVLGFIDGICRGAQNGQTDLVHVLCQLDGGLAAELHHAGVRLFGGNDVVHALRVQRVKVQTVAGVKVGGDGLGVVVDQNGFAAVLLQGPHAVHRAVVELDALTNADGAGAKDQHLLFLGFALGGCFGFLLGNELSGFVVAVVGGVEVRGVGRELGRTGIHHLETGAVVLHRQGVHLCQTLDGLILEAVLLGSLVLLFGQHAVALGKTIFQICQMLHLVQEPPVDLGDLVNGLVVDAALEGLVHAEHALGVLNMHVGHDLVIGQLLKGLVGQSVHAQLDGGNCLHHGSLEAVANAHHLAGGHHLGAQRLVGVDELIKGPLRVLDHDVVQRRLKAGAGLAGDVVGDLVQRVADGDLGGHLGNGIAGGLGSQCGRAGHTGVDLDDRIIKAVRLQSKLAVAAALDAQLGDDIQRSGAQHLVLVVGQGLGGSHDHRVAGVDADRVEVLHVTHSDHVALVVAHDLVLDLFPAGDALFHKDLMDGGKAQAVGADLNELCLVLADAAAGAAHGEGRAHDDRVADAVGAGQSVFQRLHDLGGNDGLVQLFHGLLEQLAVLGTVDGLGLAGQQTDAGAIQIAGAGQLHGQVQAHLAAEVRQHGVRLFDVQNALHDFQRHGLDVNMVGHIRVGHDGCGVGVQQNGLDALCLQGAAGLRAGVVELRSLTNDDGAGANDQHLLDSRVLRHFSVPPFLLL